MSKNFPGFRKQLELAMENHATQADFARDADIAPETLNRMINQEEIRRPSKNTLKKIASASSGKVAYESLLQACGYTETKKKQESAQTVDKQFTDFCEFLKTHKMVRYKSVNDFIDSAIMLGSECEISYNIGKPTETAESDRKTGDYAIVVNLSCNIDQEHSATTDFVVFYYITDKDTYIIASATNDVNVTAKYNSTLAKKALELRAKAANRPVDANKNILYSNKNLQRKYEPVSAELRLLHTIFGEDKNILSEENVHISGIGFYIPKQTPTFVLHDFIKAHKDTFCRSEQEKRIYNSFIESNSPRCAAVGNYNAETSTGAGSNCWLAIVVNIILRETGINTQGWLNALNDGEKAIADAIVFANSMPWEYSADEKHLTKRGLIGTLDTYARELRTDMEECSFDAIYVHK